MRIQYLSEDGVALNFICQSKNRAVTSNNKMDSRSEHTYMDEEEERLCAEIRRRAMKKRINKQREARIKYMRELLERMSPEKEDVGCAEMEEKEARAIQNMNEAISLFDPMQIPDINYNDSFSVTRSDGMKAAHIDVVMSVRGEPQFFDVSKDTLMLTFMIQGEKRNIDARILKNVDPAILNQIQWQLPDVEQDPQKMDQRREIIQDDATPSTSKDVVVDSQPQEEMVRTRTKRKSTLTSNFNSDYEPNEKKKKKRRRTSMVKEKIIKERKKVDMSNRYRDARGIFRKDPNKEALPINTPPLFASTPKTGFDNIKCYIH